VLCCELFFLKKYWLFLKNGSALLADLGFLPQFLFFAFVSAWYITSCGFRFLRKSEQKRKKTGESEVKKVIHKGLFLGAFKLVRFLEKNA